MIPVFRAKRGVLDVMMALHGDTRHVDGAPDALMSRLTRKSRTWHSAETPTGARNGPGLATHMTFDVDF